MLSSIFVTLKRIRLTPGVLVAVFLAASVYSVNAASPVPGDKDGKRVAPPSTLAKVTCDWTVIAHNPLCNAIACDDYLDCMHANGGGVSPIAAARCLNTYVFELELCQ